MFKEKRAHFIGIGGIGVSAIAKLFLCQGAKVSGSDLASSPVTDELAVSGVPVSFGHGKGNIPPECDLVVYTNALSKDNVELVEARRRNIRTISYPEALGETSHNQFVIAVSGSAGKTTTTAMVGQILIDAGLDPTIIVGSLAHFRTRGGKVLKTNFIPGQGPYFVVEADEYKRAFLNLSPKILTINNIAPDHLDYYSDLSDLQDAFSELVQKVPHDGFIITSPNDPTVMPALAFLKAVVLDYSAVHMSEGALSLPGKHNRANAQIALTVASALGVSKKVIRNSLLNFRSPWRRFEYRGQTKLGASLYDDYAHNPQKIKALIAGAREKFPEKRIVIIFQPHLYSRTRNLLSELAESFLGADKVVVTPIYAAREVFDPSISHHDLADSIRDLGRVKEVETIESLNGAVPLLKAEGEGSICFTVGAGDIYTACARILDKQT